MSMQIGIALAILVGAIELIRRGIDVRFVLIVAGVLIASLAGTPGVVLDAFQKSLGKADVIGPICTAMGFAYVLKSTGCDADMVRLLARPLHAMRRYRWVLVPGGCIIGYVANMAITSQTAAAAAVGPILIPLLLAAGFSPLAAAGTVVVGTSAGGDLFNPGESEIINLMAGLNKGAGSALTPGDVVAAIATPNVMSLLIATAVITVMVMTRASLRAPVKDGDVPALEPLTRGSILRGLLPPIPVITLLAVQPQLGLLPSWITAHHIHVSSVMLACSLLVMVVTIASRDTVGRHISSLTRTFFDGMGYAFATVISLIVAADCVIEGLTAIGLVDALSTALVSNPLIATIGSPIGTASLAVVSGSGTAPTLMFAKGVLPSLAASMPIDYALRMAAVVGIASGVGRSMSPVAAVTVFTAALSNVDPVRLALVTMWPMLASLLALIAYGFFAG